MPQWVHSALSIPLDPWDHWDLYHLWVHSDRSHLEVHLDPWLPRLLPVQRDHWDPQDPLHRSLQQGRSALSHPWVR